eukprot:g1402.t1
MSCCVLDDISTASERKRKDAKRTTLKVTDEEDIAVFINDANQKQFIEHIRKEMSKLRRILSPVKDKEKSRVVSPPPGLPPVTRMTEDSSAENIEPIPVPSPSEFASEQAKPFAPRCEARWHEVDSDVLRKGARCGPDSDLSIWRAMGRLAPDDPERCLEDTKLDYRP